MLLCNATPPPTRADDITRWDDNYVIRHTWPIALSPHIPTYYSGRVGSLYHPRTDRSPDQGSLGLFCIHLGPSLWELFLHGTRNSSAVRLGLQGKQRSLTISHLLQPLLPSSISLMVDLPSLQLNYCMSMFSCNCHCLSKSYQIWSGILYINAGKE